MQSLPVIDFAKNQSDSGLSAIANKIRQAMRSTGFFYLANHGLSTDTIERIRAAQRRFFAQDVSVKSAVAINASNRGYLASGMARMHGAVNHDQKEVFFWGAELDENHPDRRDGIPLCGANQWPDLDGFRDAVLSYADGIQQLGNRLLAAIALSLDCQATFFERHYQSPMLRGQLIRYPPTQGDEQNFGVAPHSDFGCITLLLQETAGLEVLIGKHWVGAPPIDGTLVINVGDLLERWSNLRLPSTKHRVRNLNPDERYSIAMFHDPSPRARVDPRDLDPSLDDCHFEVVTAADYIIGRNRGAFSHYGEVAGKA